MPDQNHANAWMIDPRWSVDFEVVTPEVAAELLENHNGTNRPFRDWPTIASAIKNDEWIVNGQSIAFDYNGNLINGQNRLRAITETGTAVVSVVVRGLDPAAQDTTDVGAKRTLGDQLHIHGEVNYKALAGVLRYRRAFNRLYEGTSHNFTYTVLNGLRDLEDAPHAREVVVTAALAGGKPPANISSAVLGGFAMAAIDRTDATADDFAEFFRRFHALNMAKVLPDDINDPVWRLRELVSKKRQSVRTQGSLSVRWVVAVVTKSWNAYRYGDTIANLKWADSERFPVPQ